ncbi:MAG: bifunctional 4-hydroxy-2-oxoglutarate aldolase/2-dehydro-3-deoxy-phosphogluconate aldolase [Candidatus Methylacidiphilales bacterium]|nr:bifunctional 4-hydroxy-2-oxoglutarate aldolase/2-dehydro-3-deoxy-phosphogluconate aldolase [Candidatus Methylacidiphilales bacterium]
MSFPLPWIERVRKTRILAVVNPDSAAETEVLAQSLYARGITGLELTVRQASGLESIRRIKLSCPNMIVGAGTVLNEHQVAAVHGAGADFALSPGFNPAVVKAAQNAGLPFAPGVCTPSEIETASALGCRLLTFFPCDPNGGPEFLSAISGPYLHLGLHFMPRGTFPPASATAFLQMPQVAALCAGPDAGGSWDDLALLTGKQPTH